MTDARKHPNNFRKPPKSKPAPLTPEEQAKIVAAREKAAEEQKLEAERIRLFDYNIQGTSHRGLVRILDRTIKRESVKTGVRTYEPIPGLTVAFAVVLKNVLVNTKTPTNVFETDQDGRPTRVARMDQINLLGCPMVARG